MFNKKFFFFRPITIAAVLVLMLTSQTGFSQDSARGKVLLPNGWSLSPAGTSLPLGDLPLNIAVSSSQRYMAVTNNGQSVQSIQLIDVKAQQVLDEIVIPKSWFGLKFSKDEKYLFASGGNDNRILRYGIQGKKLILQDSIALGAPWPQKISPTGIEINDKTQMMYVLTKDNNTLYVIDLNTGKIVRQFPLPDAGYNCVLSRDK